MSSRAKLVREQVDLIRIEFEEAGIKDWYFTSTRRNHVKITFYRDGKPYIMVFAPSTERHAKHNNRAHIRRMIRDAHRDEDQRKPVLRSR